MPMEHPLDTRIEMLVHWLHGAHYPVFFTGAGISTESGLPDFRGPDGLWTRQDKGLGPPPMAKPWRSVEPNQGHFALVELQRLGKLKFLISQNVDNLHLKSGIDAELLAELHGNISKLRCSRCEKTFDRSLNRKGCTCGGALVPSVVNFGQPLPERDPFLSFEHSRRSDLFVVVGSSLVVTPAADMPIEALRAGAKLVIVNAGATPLDRDAHLRFHEKTGEVLPPVVKRLKTSMQMMED